MTRRWSLRTRFVAAASACLLPLLGVVLFVLDQSLDNTRNQLLDTEIAIGETVAQGLAETLLENENALTTMAQRDEIRGMDQASAQPELLRYLQIRTSLNGLFLISSDKTVVTSAGIEPSSLLPVFDTPLGVALEAGVPGVSSPLVIPEGDETKAIALVVPIWAESGTVPEEPESDTSGEQAAETERGKPIGALGAFISLDRIQRTFLPAIPFANSDTTIAIVAEQTGIIVDQPSASSDVVNLPEDLDDPIAQAIAGRRSRQSYEDSSGAERLAVFAPVDYPPAKWAVVVTSPSPTTYAPNRQLLERGLIALTAAVVLTLALAVILGELTARPLRQLTEQAAAISRGDINRTFQPVGRGEIGALSASLRDMATRLTHQVRDVESTREEVALQAERLRELLRRTVRLQEDERRRIASEIHDAVSPLITGALYHTRALRLSNGNGTGNGEHGQDDGLSAVGELLEQAMDELHDVIFALRPPDLDDLGVVAAIDRYVQQINRTGLPSRLDVIGEPQRLSPEARLGVYRIVQEALHNALRHADADEAVVRLEWSDELLRVTIRDNGSGFDPEMAARPTSLGLLSMRERAAAIGARLEISSRPGSGTAVIIERPLRDDWAVEPAADLDGVPEQPIAMSPDGDRPEAAPAQPIEVKSA